MIEKSKIPAPYCRIAASIRSSVSRLCLIIRETAYEGEGI